MNKGPRFALWQAVDGKPTLTGAEPAQVRVKGTGYSSGLYSHTLPFHQPGVFVAGEPVRPQALERDLRFKMVA